MFLLQKFFEMIIAFRLWSTPDSLVYSIAYSIAYFTAYSVIVDINSVILHTHLTLKERSNFID